MLCWLPAKSGQLVSRFELYRHGLGALDPAGIPSFSRSHLHIATLQCALSPCAAAVRWGPGTFDPPKGPPLIVAQH